MLKSIANVLGKLGDKLLAALPGIIGGIVSWLLNMMSGAVGWMAEHLWVFVSGIGALLLIYLNKHLK